MKGSAVSGRIRLHDREFRLFLEAARIQQAVAGMAERLNSDLSGKKPHFLVVLNGAFLFAADLVKKISIPNSISFIRLSSYEGTGSTGKVKSIIGMDDMKGKCVVILEDIVDTGNTLEYLVGELDKAGASECRVAALLFKPSAYTKKRKVDYVGFEVPNEFLVGYGLDYNQAGRNLTDIYILDSSS